MTEDELKTARETFLGKTMTETQLRQAHAIASILHAEIQRSGSFRESLTDYSHAFARNKKFDALRGEAMIRDTYSARYAQTLNQTREGPKANEENLPESARTRALDCAETIEQLIQAAPTQPFYQAYDRAAVTLSGEFGITQTSAKTLMRESFLEVHDKDLYAHGKQIEEAYHKPVREAEIASRKAEHQQSHVQSQSVGQTRG